MPVTRRSRALAIEAPDLWKLVADPHHLPRWWPRVTRVEDVEEQAFTIVMATERGRLVRADQRVLESQPPRRRRWAQDLEGTPFARLLREAVTAVSLDPGEPGVTRVTLELRQRLRGMARFGALIVRRAARVQLEEALDGLERIVG